MGFFVLSKRKKGMGDTTSSVINGKGKIKSLWTHQVIPDDLMQMRRSKSVMLSEHKCLAALGKVIWLWLSTRYKYNYCWFLKYSLALSIPSVPCSWMALMNVCIHECHRRQVISQKSWHHWRSEMNSVNQSYYITWYDYELCDVIAHIVNDWIHSLWQFS